MSSSFSCSLLLKSHPVCCASSWVMSHQASDKIIALGSLTADDHFEECLALCWEFSLFGTKVLKLDPWESTSIPHLLQKKSPNFTLKALRRCNICNISRNQTNTTPEWSSNFASQVFYCLALQDVGRRWSPRQQPKLQAASSSTSRPPRWQTCGTASHRSWRLPSSHWLSKSSPASSSSMRLVSSWGVITLKIWNVIKQSNESSVWYKQPPKTKIFKIKNRPFRNIKIRSIVGTRRQTLETIKQKIKTWISEMQSS